MYATSIVITFESMNFKSPGQLFYIIFNKLNFLVFRVIQSLAYKHLVLLVSLRLYGL